MAATDDTEIVILRCKGRTFIAGADIIEATRAELAITPKEISDDEIVDRLTLALADAGACILDEGIAQRASDIDVVYCHG